MNQPLQEALEGKYEILEKIGEGGIGAVYKVRHRLLEEIRVIKVLRPEAAGQEDLRKRFLHEARMAIRLKHPNIAQLHDFSIAEDGRAYIVMEYIDGVALDALLEASGPPSVDLALEISHQGLQALHYLHEHEFVHRDVSPDNLMLTSAFDGRPLAKLIDLGIARNLGTEVRLTATGVFLGKARYCSPEQFQAGGDTPAEVDRRGDIYSFGIMLYEVLTGVYPMEGNNFAELAGAHLFNPPKDFAETDPDGRISAGLRQAVLRAVAKSPDERFATAADFAKELNKYRDPDSSLRDEFDRTVEIATTAMPRIPGPGRPGSTQERINLEFGMGKTPSGARDSTADEAVADGTVAAVTRRPLEVQVKQIEELIARGQRKRAIRALDRALADHGSAEPLAELRQAIDRLGETAEGGRKMPLAAIVAVILLLLAGALGAWWWSQRAPLAEGETVMADGGSELFVSSAPRFDPDAPGSTESEFDGEIGEPPPLEEPSDPVAETSAQSPETQPATAQSVNGAPEEGSENSASAEEDDPPPADGSAASTATPPPPAKVTQEIFELGVGVEAPVLVLLPQPQVPSEGRKLREELTVMVRVLVDENGSVLRAEIASGPSFRRKYRDAALEAAQKASFRPARRGDTFGRMWTEVRVTFQPE